MLHENWRIQPSEIDRMEMYRYQYMLEDLTEILKEKAKANEGTTGTTKPDGMFSGIKKQMSSVFSGVKMPKLK